jgi:hypothetical protein
MAHSHAIAYALEQYHRKFAAEKQWKKHVDFLYTRDEETNRLNKALYGNFRLAPRVKFYFKMLVQNDGTIHVYFWREDPASPGYIGCPDPFSMRLFAALELFPEMLFALVSEDEEDIWGKCQ